MRGTFVLSLLSALGASASLLKSNLKTNVDVLALDYSFNPVKASYWTGYPHHRRTPFAVSPDGKSAYIAYLDSSATDVHVQQLDPGTFKATGTTVTVSGGKEAGGLIAHNDGFALLTNEIMPSGTTNAPPSDTPVPVLYRYTSGKQTFKTWLGGPDVHTSDGLSASPDLNGDLVYSETAGLYGAYFVVTDYSRDASGHFGDSIEYVSTNGTLVTIAGASSSWGCSHNTGLAFEAADAAPFASICAEDQGAIWLNTKTQGMSTDGVKISNENTTNGAGGEAMGGMSGSYSALARFAETTKYIFAWVSRGAMDVTENAWMGSGYTNVQNRTNGRNVAISLFSDKYTKVGDQATSVVGTEDGDSQVNWVTSGSNDCSNAHVATFGSANALVSWEEISNPTCDFIAMGCRGTFAGTFFQQVDSTGAKVGEAISSEDVYVAGDMVTMSDGRVCWPYVSMTWDLSQAVDDSSSSGTNKISLACLSLGVVDTSSAATTATASVDASSNIASGTSSDDSASASIEVASTAAPAAPSAAVPAASGDSSHASSDASPKVSSVASSEASNASAVVSAAASAAPVVPAASGSADTGFKDAVHSAIPSAIPTGIPADKLSDEAAFSACAGAPKAHHGNLGHHIHHGHRSHHTSLLPDF
ncbi:hypothetical protein N7499_003636 [Penicillium canescens]|uniref:Uncharacterized protein n=1 Tax=Penicillium canescens TaxID=5083 RepID=A0AAD6IAE2_PENCN|nr:uncharacterized protein N7446_012588 [Penicillium canescens]KAJ6018337.1 hypothetical protein N7522_001801 [Penicillium canescens]KAJ6038774.1 hypothetical protein N7460_007491 [Penicillium canescens]KAJ6045724.1 hypothetical protein N7446_012588 [Penicillium canescens]KAJ6066314.1 hypothetical protein N7444_000067 [Penicillium canescens]KAJ6090922.1 hypothetical protein N7499_003636 [Penicillium canescens]